MSPMQILFHAYNMGIKSKLNGGLLLCFETKTAKYQFIEVKSLKVSIDHRKTCSTIYYLFHY